MPLEESAARLRSHVQRLAATPRGPGTPAHRQAADYIRAHLEAAGFAVDEHACGERGLDGVNLLTRTLPDRAALPLLIVGAHYDSVADSPGADDNASAVAALLELAHWIQPRLKAAETSCTRRLQLVAYDLEEYGLVGSLDHSQEIQRVGTTVAAMISLEMLGYTDHRADSQGLPPHLTGLYPSVGNFIGVCGNEASRGPLKVMTEALKTIAGLPVEALAVPGNGEMLYEVRLSDHSSFWDRGYQALMITDTSFFRNPHYHRATDTPDSLDYPFLAKVTAGVCEGVRRLLELPDILRRSNHALAPQCLQTGGVEAEDLLQQRIGVLAQGRRRGRGRRCYSGDVKGGAQQFHRVAFGIAHRHAQAAGGCLRMGKQVGVIPDRGVRDLGGSQQVFPGLRRARAADASTSGTRASRFCTLRVFVVKRGSSARSERAAAWQKRCHWPSLPTASTSQPSAVAKS